MEVLKYNVSLMYLMYLIILCNQMESKVHAAIVTATAIRYKQYSIFK